MKYEKIEVNKYICDEIKTKKVMEFMNSSMNTNVTSKIEAQAIDKKIIAKSVGCNVEQC